MARSLRQVLAGSLVLSAAAVFVAAWATYAVSMTPTPAAAVTLVRVVVEPSEPFMLVQDSSETTAPIEDTAAAALSDQVRSPALTSATPADEPERQTSSSAIASAASAESEDADAAFATSIVDDESAALVARAALRDNALPFSEPMRGLTRPPTVAEERDAFLARSIAREAPEPFIEPMRGLSRAPTVAEERAALVARAAAREQPEPFVEPMRGLSRPPTVAERNAAIVARAAAREDEPSIIEAWYPIDASVLQTPMLEPGDYVEATISFYYCVQGATSEGGDGGTFCGAMRDGTVVYDGAAACAWSYLGQRFIIVGDPLERVYTCADTGSAVHGLHRDIWFYSAAEGWTWQLSVGTRGLLLIVE